MVTDEVQKNGTENMPCSPIIKKKKQVGRHIITGKSRHLMN